MMSNLRRVLIVISCLSGRGETLNVVCQLSLATSGTGIPRYFLNHGTASPADGITDSYLLLLTSDASGCDRQLQM